MTMTSSRCVVVVAAALWLLSLALVAWFASVTDADARVVTRTRKLMPGVSVQISTVARKGKGKGKGKGKRKVHST